MYIRRSRPKKEIIAQNHIHSSRIRRSFLLAYSSIISSGSTSVDLLTCSNANPVSLSSPIVLRRYVFRRFSAENDLSAVALDTGIVPNRRRRVVTAGRKFSFPMRMAAAMSFGLRSSGSDWMRLIHVLTCDSTSRREQFKSNSNNFAASIILGNEFALMATGMSSCSRTCCGTASSSPNRTFS